MADMPRYHYEVWADRSLSLIGDYDNLPTPFGEEPLFKTPHCYFSEIQLWGQPSFGL